MTPHANEAAAARIPGALGVLVARGCLDERDLVPLLALVPVEERYAARAEDPEVFDTTRWPATHDLALAKLAAGRLPDPEGLLARARADLARAGQDVTALGRVLGCALGRFLKAHGQDPRQRRTLLHLEEDELAALSAEPSPSAEQADRAFWLVDVSHKAAQGLRYYHVHRGLTEAVAQPAASLLEAALQADLLSPVELIAAAEALAGSRSAGP